MATVGIFCHGQAGDIMTAMSVFKYRYDLWKDAKIVWYADENNFDLFKYQDNIEVRRFPRGFGHPLLTQQENKKLEGTDLPRWEDWQPLVDANNHLDLQLKANYPSLDDIDFGFFPAPHQMTPIQRHGYDYPNCSKKVFGVPFDWQWHPFLKWSDEERWMANTFVDIMGGGKKVFIETFAGSSQSVLDEAMIVNAMNICNEVWPDCNFIFGSHKFLRKQEEFPAYLFEQPNIYSCRDFTVRQTALIAEKCNLMLSVSSGLTVAASGWYLNSPPILQFCGSTVCSTKALANGRFELVTADDKKLHDAKNMFFLKLLNLLNQYK